MRPRGYISTGALLLFVGMVAPTSAQEEPAAPDAKPLIQAPSPAPDRQRQLAGGLRAGAAPAPSAEEVAQRKLWHRARARSWQTQHFTWSQRGGYRGGRISEDEFRAYYGREHLFRLSRLPLDLVGGHVRFQYGRYWFTLVDPWPEYWPDNWFETDSAYVNYYDDGYYLFNDSRRGVRVAVEVIPD